MTKKYERTDEWYDQARNELRLMELLEQAGPMTAEVMAITMSLETDTIWIMLDGLRLAECVSLNRKTHKFSLVPVLLPAQGVNP